MIAIAPAQTHPVDGRGLKILFAVILDYLFEVFRTPSRRLVVSIAEGSVFPRDGVRGMCAIEWM